MTLEVTNSRPDDLVSLTLSKRFILSHLGEFLKINILHSIKQYSDYEHSRRVVA